MIRALALCLLASPAYALTCDPHDKLQNYLARDYGQTVVRMGEVQSQPPRMMELYLNPRLGTWTITLTGVTGESCIYTSGGRLVVVAPGLPS